MPRTRFAAAVALSLLLAGVAAPQQPTQTQPKARTTLTGKDAEVERAKLQQKTAEMFLGFMQQVIKADIESKARQERLKAEREDKARLQAEQERERNLQAFRGTVDLFLDTPINQSGAVPDVPRHGAVLAGVTLSRTAEVAGKTFLQLESEATGETWLVDPARVAAVRVRPATKKQAAQKTGRP